MSLREHMKKKLLTSLAIVGATFLGLDFGGASADQQTCDLPTWVANFLVRKLDARSMLKDGAAAACHADTDVDYCEAPAEVKAFIKQQNANYQRLLLKYAIPSSSSSCSLCLVSGLYKSVVTNTDSIQNLCKKLKVTIGGNSTLMGFYSRMGCDFSIDQAGLTNINYDDSFWNTGPNSVRFWLLRSISDAQIPLPDTTVGQDMDTAGGFLNRFVTDDQATPQGQQALADAFKAINCVPLSTCDMPPVQCP